jgi:hypothetical protein
MTQTQCYKCEEDIEVEDITQVHPLCTDCQYEFDDWLQSAMMGAR